MMLLIRDYSTELSQMDRTGFIAVPTNGSLFSDDILGQSASQGLFLLAISLVNSVALVVLSVCFLRYSRDPQKEPTSAKPIHIEKPDTCLTSNGTANSSPKIRGRHCRRRGRTPKPNKDIDELYNLCQKILKICELNCGHLPIGDEKSNALQRPSVPGTTLPDTQHTNDGSDQPTDNRPLPETQQTQNISPSATLSLEHGTRETEQPFAVETEIDDHPTQETSVKSTDCTKALEASQSPSVTSSGLCVYSPAQQDAIHSGQHTDGVPLVDVGKNLGVNLETALENVHKNPSHVERELTEELTNTTREDIMDLHTNVGNLLNEFPWITGCSVSCDNVQVVIDNSVIYDEKHLVDKLRGRLPQHLHQYLSITEKGPSLEPLHSRYGAGCTVHELDENGETQRSATMTLMACMDEEVVTSYGFTVGHSISQGKNCQIISNARTHCRGQCLVSINNTTSTDLSNVKTKIHDIALLKMNQPLSQSNRIRSGDASDCQVKVEMEAPPSSLVGLFGADVLIHGGPERGTMRGFVAHVHSVRVTDAVSHQSKLSVNLLEIKSSDPDTPLAIQTGHSGSLVTSLPHGDLGVVKALFYLAGCNPDDHSVAYGVPLWEALSLVCAEQPNIQSLL